MDFRVILLCIVTAYGKTPTHNPYYGADASLESGDGRGQGSDVKQGFVQPVDFDSFTQRFVGEEEQDGRVVSFGKEKATPGFGSDSEKSGAFQIPNSEFAPFSGPVFHNENRANKTGFVHPVQFPSSFDKGEESKSKVYKTNIKAHAGKAEPSSSEHAARASDGENDDGDSYRKHSSQTQTFRRSTRPAKAKSPRFPGKSSYPPPHRKPSSSDYYSGVLSKPKDVEMILPKDKVLFLPMVNGRPKPYDGYRAAPESEGYETFEKGGNRETREQREKRLSEGEIIYGKPKIPLSELYHRHLKRSPAEYYGGIYPYYDYSDSKLSVSGDTDPNAPSRGKKSSASDQKKKKAYPKKHKQRSREKPYNPYKYPKENTRKRNKDEDSQGYASAESLEEAEGDSEEDGEDKKGGKPLYKYTYDNSFTIPELEIKTYPYERKLRDSKVEGSSRDDSYDVEDSVDEYTAGYDRYIKTLPSDLESYFGSPDVSDKFSVEATQNLEKNKNCKKIENAGRKSEGNSQKDKPEAEAETQVCYICSDPKTGDNYEQCAYKSRPKSQKYFFGGTTSFQTNETAEPTTYRYRRSTYARPYRSDPYSLEESEARESRESKEDEDSSEEFYKKPRKKSKKKLKKQRASSSSLYGKKHPQKRGQSYKVGEPHPYFLLHGASTNKRGRAAKSDETPKSYDGPKYTYEGPEETYEGPSQPYEGPKETYEGPAEPYEGPINQEYYDTADERIEDDEEESSNQEPQSASPAKTRIRDEYQRPKPKKRQSYYSPYGRSRTPPKYSDEDDGESYGSDESYASDYRFGPEHFVDEEGAEDGKQREEVKTTTAPKSSEKRGPHKFPVSEGRSAAASDKEEKEEPIGDAKMFKNGDVCQKKRKEGMICMVCKNEKTAATYEQCQYSTKPKEKYYAYGSQKSYTTKNPNAEEKEDDSYSDQYPEKSDIVEKKILIKKQRKVFGYEPGAGEGLAVAESNNSPLLLPRDLYGGFSDKVESVSEDESENGTRNREFTESVERIEPRDGIEGLEEYLYDAEDSEKKATEEENQSYKSYDDYFHDLFPEFGKSSSDAVSDGDEKEESESERHLAFDPFSNVRKFHEENSEHPEKYSRDEEEEEEGEGEKNAEASRPEELRLKDKRSQIPPDFFLPYNEENHKKDLEKALGEFQNKDWSNCKKIVKKKLTCYQCVDKNGVNNEECMYVEASQPISKHLAYHEKKELKPSAAEAENKTIEGTTELFQPENADNEKSLRRFRKAKNSHEELIEVAEPPRDAEYVNNSTEKGDFGGVDKLQIKQPQTNPSPEIPLEQVPAKTKGKKQKRQPKKRNKTIRNETTTERFEKIRKRKFPVKKFAEPEEATADDQQEEGSFGLKNSRSAAADEPPAPAPAPLNATRINPS